MKRNNLKTKIIDALTPHTPIVPLYKALKTGGFLVSYSPSVPQTMDFVNALSNIEGFVHLMTIELIERGWEIEERKVRPKTRGRGHTGFLSFVRKIK